MLQGQLSQTHLGVRLLAEPVTISPTLFSNLCQDRRRYKEYFDEKHQTMSNLLLGQLLYVDRPPLISLITDSNVENYNKMLPIAYESFRLYRVPSTPSRWMKTVIQFSI